jgi:hypothetical protein
MTTNFQKLLQDKAGDSLFDGKGDEEHDGHFYLIGGFDCFLSSAAEALAADGVKRQTIMNLFITHALEVMQKTPGIPRIPPNTRKNTDTACRPPCIFTAFTTIRRRQTDECGE